MSKSAKHLFVRTPAPGPHPSLKLRLIVPCTLRCASLAGLWFALSLATCALPAPCQEELFRLPPSGGTIVSLEDGKMVAGFQTWVEAIHSARRDPKAHRAAQENAYLDHWLSVLKQNIRTLEERKQAKRSTLDEYQVSFLPEMEKLTHYLELRKALKMILDQKGLPENFFPYPYGLLKDRGHNPWTWHEEVARNSRPEPLELEEELLGIEPPAIDPEADYWADETGAFSFVVTNQGQEVIEGVVITTSLSHPLGKSIVSSQGTCQLRNGGADAICDAGTLEEGTSVDLDAQLQLDAEKLELPRDNGYRTTVPVTLGAVSSESPAEASEDLSFIVRDCAADYRDRLERIQRSVLPRLQGTFGAAAAPISGLPGARLNRPPKKILVSELRQRSHQAVINRGADDFLMDAAQPGGELYQLQWQARRRLEALLSAPPGREFCHSPLPHLNALRETMEPLKREAETMRALAENANEQAAILADLFLDALGSIQPNLWADDRGRTLRRTALIKGGSFLVNQGNKLIESTGYQAEQARKLAQEAKAAAEAAETAARRAWVASRNAGAIGVAAANAEAKPFADAAMATQRLAAARAGQVAVVSRTLSFLGLAKSTYDIGKSLIELGLLSSLESELAEFLAWQETASYLNGLDQRYASIIEATEAYLHEIEEAHGYGCTCDDPF